MIVAGCPKMYIFKKNVISCLCLNHTNFSDRLGTFIELKVLLETPWLWYDECGNIPMPKHSETFGLLCHDSHF